MDGDKCVGFYSCLDFDIYCRGAKLSHGGIAGVGVIPDRRHTGLGSQIMRYSLREMFDSGKALSSLYGFSEAYYRQFGYEVCGARFEISCPTAYLPDIKPSLPIRRLGQEEFGLLKDVYDRFAVARSGTGVRNDLLWRRVVDIPYDADPPLAKRAAYLVGEPGQAYIILRHDVTFHVEQEVREIAWATREGYESALGFLKALAINKSSVCWKEPSDSPFLASYVRSSSLSTIKWTNAVMFRVIDVAKALSALKPTAGFGVRISDPDLPENDGVWQVGPSGVKRGGEADFACGIREFTQALLGQPSLSDLARNDAIEVLRPAGLEKAFRTLPPQPVTCLDFF